MIMHIGDHINGEHQAGGGHVCDASRGVAAVVEVCSCTRTVHVCKRIRVESRASECWGRQGID